MKFLAILIKTFELNIAKKTVFITYYLMVLNILMYYILNIMIIIILKKIV